MPRITYVPRRFSPGSMALVETANEIIAAYQAQGYQLTLRQLYYQFVARDVIPNRMSEYKRLGSIINDARLAGLIDWNAIEDRTRNLLMRTRWGSPEEMVAQAAEQYHEDYWLDQDQRPEVWIEKDALIGVIERVCRDYDVPYFACRGNVSQSEQWGAGQRFREVIKGGQTPVVIHLGDHDPSGLDMTRDNEDRLTMFAGAPVPVRRVALNMNQVQQYSPPPNPAKTTDSRYRAYAREFGTASWELDALDPAVIGAIVERAIKRCITNRKSFEGRKLEARKRRNLLRGVSKRWPAVTAHVRRLRMKENRADE